MKNYLKNSGLLRASAILSAVLVVSGAGAQTIRARVDGDLVEFRDMQPIMMDYRVMVPVRGVFEKMNANVEWDENQQRVTATRGDEMVRFPINSRQAWVNGKQVTMEAPAIMRNGRVMVPLRFIAEAFHADVRWNEGESTVEIQTNGIGYRPSDKNRDVPPNLNRDIPRDASRNYTMMRIDSGTVIPFRLNDRLTSDRSRKGDTFTAELDNEDRQSYQGLPRGTVLEGHADVTRERRDDTPGVLGLAFDNIRLPDGRKIRIYGTLIGLDDKSVVNEKGRWVSRPGAKTDDLKYVGYGAGGGALLAIATKGNVLTTTLIGGALGFLFDEIQRDKSKSSDVIAEIGKRFGVRLTRDFSFRVNTRTTP